MTSPDVRPYVNLTLLDVSMQEIVDAAKDLVSTRFPEWTPLEGTMEMVLIEAFAEVVSELVFAINRLPSATLEIVLRLFGLNPAPGVRPVSTILFTVSDLTQDHTVPAGTVCKLDSDSGLAPVLFTTDSDLLIPAGATSGSVTVTATEYTSDANGTPAGRAVSIISAVPFVDSSTLGTPVTGGVSPEDSYDFLVRARLRLLQISTTLVLPEQFQAAAAEVPGVVRVQVVNNYNATTAATQQGHVTVAVLGDGGVSLTAQVKQDLASALTLRALAGLAIHVIDATVNDIKVDVVVVRLPGFSADQVRSSVLGVLATYLNPNIWPVSARVYVNEIISLVDHAPGVDRVVGIPALNGVGSDLAMTGLVPVARLNLPASTVTVNEP